MMIVHNNTVLPIEAIEARQLVGFIKHNWRKRNIRLYASDDPTMLYMVGRSFDSQTIVISHEPIGMNEGIAMDYWKHGQKVLTRD